MDAHKPNLTFTNQSLKTCLLGVISTAPISATAGLPLAELQAEPLRLESCCQRQTMNFRHQTK
jgi:hypothetical protein